MEKEFILEIGTEELPVEFVTEVPFQLKNILEKQFKENGIKFNKLETYATPRRIICTALLEEKQQDQLIEKQGPPYSVFYDSKGNITKAGRGFLKANNISESEIKIKETNKGKYIFIEKLIKGKPVKEILGDLIINSIKKIHLPKAMRWEETGFLFLRPIRWLLLMFDSQVIPIKIGSINSNKFSYGHRVLSPEKFEVKSIEQFKKELIKRYVIFSQKERESRIKQEIQNLLSQDETYEEEITLLTENANLVEYPFVQIGEFKKEFLHIPYEILITAMKYHQKVFPVYKNNKLSNKFIAILNNKPNENTLKGYERVIKARLEDAKFYFEEDRKVLPLENFIKKIKGIYFLEDLGTLYDKSIRIQKLSEKIANKFGLEREKIENIKRCAFLCKSDIGTEVVNEFPELQGTCGRIYALLSGEKKEVSTGIEEHYLPKGADDKLPELYTGIVVGLADRIDSITGCFIKNFVPTGSVDPYHVRRNSIAIINILIEKKLFLNLFEMFNESINLYHEQGLYRDKDNTEIINKITSFFKARVKNIFLDKGIKSDEIDGIISANFDDIYDTFLRAKVLNKFRKNPEFKSVFIAFKRMFNIIKKAQFKKAKVKEELFIEKEEKDLYSFHNKKVDFLKNFINKKEYERCFEILGGYKKVVDKFFDTVLVMDKNPEIRENRLNLLNHIVEDFRKIVDFSKIAEQL